MGEEERGVEAGVSGRKELWIVFAADARCHTPLTPMRTQQSA